MHSPPDSEDDCTCLVLVDYDNAFPPSAELSDDEIAADFGEWLERLLSNYPAITRFDIRFYGGWYNETGLSHHGSAAARIVAYLPDFPVATAAGKIVRGGVMLAAAPLVTSTSSPLLGSHRRRGSLPRIRLSRSPHPDNCAQADATCPAAILKAFTKSSTRVCPSQDCSLVASQAFITQEQKMVDTLLSTDILTADSSPAGFSILAVVSADSDFLPPLLARQQMGDIDLVQIVPRSADASEYAIDVLRDAGVEIMEIPR